MIWQQNFWPAFSYVKKSRTSPVRAETFCEEIVYLVWLSKIWYSVLPLIKGRPSRERLRNYNVAVALNSGPELPQTNIVTATFQLSANLVSAGANL